MRPGSNTDAQNGTPVPQQGTWRGAARTVPWASERRVWTAAVLVGAFDVLLTLHGLSVGFVEANPVAAAVLGAVGAVPGLVGLKALALAVLAVGSRVVPPAVRSSPPALLAVTWTAAALYNCWIVFA